MGNVLLHPFQFRSLIHTCRSSNEVKQFINSANIGKKIIRSCEGVINIVGHCNNDKYKNVLTVVKHWRMRLLRCTNVIGGRGSTKRCLLDELYRRSHGSSSFCYLFGQSLFCGMG